MHFKEKIMGHFGVLIDTGNDGFRSTDCDFNTQRIKTILIYFRIEQPPVGEIISDVDNQSTTRGC